MKLSEKDKWLEQAISSAAPFGKPAPDFEKWRQEHTKAVEILKSQGRQSAFTPSKMMITIKIWRTVMRSRITKPAAAAVAIIALLVCISQFGVPDGASVAFGRVREAVSSKPWLHVTFTGENKLQGLKYDYEIWLSPVREVRILKVPSGPRVYWSDYLKRERTAFDPVSNTVTLSYEYECDQFKKSFAQNVEPPWSYVSPMFDPEVITSSMITERSEVFDGRDARVYGLTRTEKEGTLHFEIMADTNDNLPIAITMQAIDSNGAVLYHIEGRCDYPDQGPSDIYELGVPQDAKVIDELPRPGAEELLEICRKFRSNFTSYVIIVMLESSSRIHQIDLNYIKGDTFKAGQYFKANQFVYTFEGKDEDRLNEKIAEGFDSLLEWIRGENETMLMSIDLWDGSHRHLVRRNNKPAYQKSRDLGATRDIYGYAWPYAQPAGMIVENEYASENSLICLRAYGSLFYFDPEHDYICMRREYMKDYADGNGAYQLIREVTEVAQTEEGWWYPRRMALVKVNKNAEGEEISRQTTCVDHIYLKIVSEFPADIFEADNLPKAIE